MFIKKFISNYKPSYPCHSLYTSSIILNFFWSTPWHLQNPHKFSRAMPMKVSVKKVETNCSILECLYYFDRIRTKCFSLLGLLDEKIRCIGYKPTTY